MDSIQGTVGSVGASVGAQSGEMGNKPAMVKVQDDWIEGMLYKSGIEPNAKTSFTENVSWPSDKASYSETSLESSIVMSTAKRDKMIQAIDNRNACIYGKYAGACATASKTGYIETSFYSLIETLRLRSNTNVIEEIRYYNTLMNLLTAFIVPLQSRVLLSATQGFAYTSAFATAYNDDLGEKEIISAGTTAHYFYIPIYLGFFNNSKLIPISHIADLQLDIVWANPTSYVLDYTASASAFAFTFTITELALRCPIIKYNDASDVNAFNQMFYGGGGIKINAQSYMHNRGAIVSGTAEVNLPLSFRRESLRSCIAVMHAISLTSTRKQQRFIVNGTTSYQYWFGNDAFPRFEVPIATTNRGALMNEILAYFDDRSTLALQPRFTEVIIVPATETAYYEALTCFPVELSSVNDDGSLVKSGINTIDVTSQHLTLKATSNFTANSTVDIFGCYDIEFQIGTDNLVRSTFNGELSSAPVQANRAQM
jgi:hypothetical protein